jgi:hypothetical protein
LYRIDDAIRASDPSSNIGAMWAFRARQIIDPARDVIHCSPA